MAKRKPKRAADALPGPVSCGKVKRVKKATSLSKSSSKKNSCASGSVGGPFPNFMRPSPEECWVARDGLAGLHGEYQYGDEGSVLSSLMKTMLSQNTTDITSARAFGQLQDKFGQDDWDSVRVATEASIAESIRCCGLADIRANRMKAILQQVHHERGETSME